VDSLQLKFNYLLLGFFSDFFGFVLLAGLALGFGFGLLAGLVLGFGEVFGIYNNYNYYINNKF
jgi:hypothetical protein